MPRRQTLRQSPTTRRTRLAFVVALAVDHLRPRRAPAPLPPALPEPLVVVVVVVVLVLVEVEVEDPPQELDPLGVLLAHPPLTASTA